MSSDVQTESNPAAKLDVLSAQSLVPPDEEATLRSKLIAQVMLLILFLIAWELVVRAGLIREFFVSRPTLVAGWFAESLGDPKLWKHFIVTFREAVLGLLISLVGGVAGALALARSNTVYQILKPYHMALYSVPRIALAPLFILWFGIGEASKVALSVSLVIFVVFFNTYSGAVSVDKRLVDAFRTMGASRRFIYWHLVLPHSLPYIFSSMRISVGLSLVAVIAGEFIAGSKGLGYLIVRSANLFFTTETMALLIMLGVLGLLAELLMSAAERRLFVWRPQSKL